MSLSSTTARNDYLGADSVGPFPYTFRVFAATDLAVTKRAVSGAETHLAYPVDFTAAGVGTRAGGSITLATALAVGETLTIRRVLPINQPTDLRNLGSFFPETFEDQLDRLAMIDQQQQDVLDRSLTFPASVTPGSVSATLPVPQADMALVWDAAGAALTNRALDAAAPVALPGNGRLVATLTAYLANNAVFNVKDFGAKGDGATIETGAIHAARDAAAVGGGQVYFPPGTYLVDPDVAMLRLNKSNVFYIGAGATIKRKTGAASTDLCFLGDAAVTISNTGIDGLIFDGNRASTVPAGAGVVLFGKNLDGFRIGSIEVKNGPFFGFHFQGCVNGQAGRVYTHHHNRDGFTWSDGCAFVAIGQVVSKYTGDDGMAFNQESGPAVHDISVASYVSYNSGLNSDGSGPGGFGIKFSGNVHHIVVAGIQVDSPADAGVGFILGFGGAGSPSYCSVSGRVTGAGQRAGAANRNGLLISGGANNVRATMEIEGGLSDGVLVNSGCTDIHLDLVSDSNAGAGVKLDGTGTRLGRITGRVRARNNGANGILAIGLDRLVLDAPVCTDNATNGAAGFLTSSGICVQDVKSLRIVGGDSSQWNTGAANKQAYGLAITGTACVDVTVIGHAASVALATQNIYVQTLPSGSYTVSRCDGFTLGAASCETLQKSAVGSFIFHGYGNGVPAIACAPGSTYRRLDGGISTMFYVKASATDGSGWVPLVSIDGTGSISPTTGTFKVGGNQVVGARGAAVADVASANASDLATAITLANETKAQLNALLSRLRSTTGHGLIT